MRVNLLKLSRIARAPAGSTANHASIPSGWPVPGPRPPGAPGGTTRPSSNEIGAFMSPTLPVCPENPSASPFIAPAVTQPPCPLSIITFCLRCASTRSLILIHSRPMSVGCCSLACLSYTAISTSFALSIVISKLSIQRSVFVGWERARCVPSTRKETYVSICLEAERERNVDTTGA